LDKEDNDLYSLLITAHVKTASKTTKERGGAGEKANMKLEKVKYKLTVLGSIPASSDMRYLRGGR
jgi:hypothetical protein